MKNIFIYIAVTLFIGGCYTSQDIKIDNGFRQLVVDGMLVFDPLNPFKTGGDIITISNSTEYVSKDSTIPYINDAVLILRDTLGNSETLIAIGNGQYKTQSLILRPALKYILDIKLANNEEYTASTYIPIRNADFRGLPQPVDQNGNIRDTCRTSGTPIGVLPAGPFIDLDLYDLPGPIPDIYWVRPYVKRIAAQQSPYNSVAGVNTALGVTTFAGIENTYSGWKTFRGANKINIAFDFSNGRQNTEPFASNNVVKMNMPFRLSTMMASNGGEAGSAYPFYFPGDSVKVKVFAITLEHLNFLSALAREISNGSGGGLSGLFSRPPANAPTNIINKDANGKKAIGFFGGGMLVEKSTRVNINSKFIIDQDKSKVSANVSCE